MGDQWRSIWPGRPRRDTLTTTWIVCLALCRGDFNFADATGVRDVNDRQLAAGYENLHAGAGGPTRDAHGTLQIAHQSFHDPAAKAFGAFGSFVR
jgi:hypothetical protein